jgi:hypothetical protein
MGQEWPHLGADVDCSRGSVDLEVWKWWKLVTECCLVYMVFQMEEHEVLPVQHCGEYSYVVVLSARHFVCGTKARALSRAR